jgi:hypothetical protein
MTESSPSDGESRSQLIDARVNDVHEGEEIDGDPFKALVSAAVALNASSGRRK